MIKNLALFVTAAVVALTAGIYTERLIVAAPDPVYVSEFVLPDTTGTQRSLSEWKGKVLIINFWTTWCPPCLKEIPEFIAMQREYGEKGLQFVGIAVEDKEPVKKFAAMMGINYPVLVAEEEGIAMSVGLGNVIGALPFSVVVDRHGKITHTHPGPIDRRQLEEVITPLL